MGRLSTKQLNTLFVDNIGDKVVKVYDINSKPLLIDIQMDKIIKMRVYLFNCTNPPGGRTLDEYKCQLILPDQKRGMRSNFDYSDERFVILGGYTRPEGEEEKGVFILWDPMCHVDFAYSANVQVKSGTIISTLWEHVIVADKKNGERIVAAREDYLYEAINKRARTISPALTEDE